jgi:hypothetical protein
MCAPAPVTNQLKAFNGGMVIVAMCFSLVAFYVMYTVFALWTMLVQHNIDNKSGYTNFATVADYINSLPDWVGSAYQIGSWLLLALQVWIILNLIHWIILVVYPLWSNRQKEKYPMSY